MINIIEYDLIKFALERKCDVIAHSVNCFNTQKSGLAKQMSTIFATNTFPMELKGKGSYSKLGNIDYLNIGFTVNKKGIIVVNCYTQYYHARNAPRNYDSVFVDYDAFSLCMKKINFIFKGKHIALPYNMSSYRAGGDWNIIYDIIKKELKDCKVTICKLNKK